MDVGATLFRLPLKPVQGNGYGPGPTQWCATTSSDVERGMRVGGSTAATVQVQEQRCAIGHVNGSATQDGLSGLSADVIQLFVCAVVHYVEATSAD
jgi:hypothetical protein